MLESFRAIFRGGISLEDRLVGLMIIWSGNSDWKARKKARRRREEREKKDRNKGDKKSKKKE